MKKNLFLSFVNILLIYFFSISYLPTANAAMNQGRNYLDLKILKEKDLDSLPSNSPSTVPENDVKIFFTKNSDGTKGFKFTISNQIIDYGILTPTNPIIRENLLKIFNTSSGYFSVYTYQNHPLTHSSSSAIFIPDTSCDNGACTHFISSTWENTLTYGFGYSCENMKTASCMPDFPNTNYFKQFPNLTDKEEPQPVIRGSKNANEIVAGIIHKVNVSTSQPQQKYSNKINYLLVPGY